MSFKIGDVVVLNSGSVKMTVEEVLEDGTICCIWFLNGEVLRDMFKSAMIRLAAV